jgi:hypothetical protein
MLKYRQCAICGTWFDEDRVAHTRIIHGKRVTYYCDGCIKYLKDVYKGKGGQTNESKQETREQ